MLEPTSEKFYDRLRRILLRCGPFDSDQELRARFVDDRIRPWRNDVRSAGSPRDRVNQLLDLLCDSSYQGENGLTLFLQVLRDAIEPGDACRSELAEVLREWQEMLETSLAVPSGGIRLRYAPHLPQEEIEYLRGRLELYGYEEDLIDLKFELEEPKLERNEQSSDEVNFIDVLIKHRIFVLVGDPGSGKTTILRSLLRALSKHLLQLEIEKDDAWLDLVYPKSVPPIPLWINLGDKRNPVQKDEFLDFWWNQYGLPRTPESAINNGTVWFLLDGLNELPRSSTDDLAKRIDSVSNLIDELQPTPTRAILTSRPYDYKSLDLKKTFDLPLLKIRKLDFSSIQEFVHLKSKQSNIIHIIQENNAIETLARNPFALQMLVKVDNAGLLEGFLESPTLKNLYDRYLEERYKYHTTTFKKERKQKAIVLKRDVLEDKLQQLAFSMLKSSQGTTVSIKWAKKILGRQCLIDAINWEVLVPEEDERVRFYHQTLHSHFALPRVTRTFQPRWYDSFLPARASRMNRLIRIIAQLPETASTAILAMTSLMTDQDESISREAATAIDQLWESALEARETTVVTLQTAIPALVKALDSKQREVTRVARELLVELALRAIDELVVAVTGDEPVAARNAADVIAKIGPSTVPYLNEVLPHPDREVRNRILGILRRIRSSDSVLAPSLLELLENEVDDRNVRLVQALLYEMGRKDPSVLVSKMSHNNPTVRLRIVEILTNQYHGSDDASSPSLIHPDLVSQIAETAQYDSDVKVRNKSVKGLRFSAIDTKGHLDEKLSTLETLLDDDLLEIRTVSIESLSTFGEIAAPLIPTIVGMLRVPSSGDSDKAINNSVLDALARILMEPEIVIREVASVLAQLDDEAQKKALELIERYATAAELHERIRKLEESSEKERLDVRVGGEVAVKAQRTMEENSVKVLEAEKLIERFSREASETTDTIIRFVNSSNPEIRLASLRALGAIGKDAVRAAPLIEASLNDETREVSAAAADALLRIAQADNPLIESLINDLDSTELKTKHQAIRNLGNLKSRATLARLLELLEKETLDTTRILVAEAVWKIGRLEVALKVLGAIAGDITSPQAHMALHKLDKIGSDGLLGLKIALTCVVNSQVKSEKRIVMFTELRQRIADLTSKEQSYWN